MNEAMQVTNNEELVAYTNEQLQEILHTPDMTIDAMIEINGALQIVSVTPAAKGWYAYQTDDGTIGKLRAKDIYALEEPTGENNMSNTLRKYRTGYTPSVSVSGAKSLHCGDAVAEALEYKELDALYALVGMLLEGWDAETLAAKYSHLNRGQQRMNLGNRLRAAYKRGEETVVQWVEDHLGE